MENNTKYPIKILTSIFTGIFLTVSIVSLNGWFAFVAPVPFLIGLLFGNIFGGMLENLNKKILVIITILYIPLSISPFLFSYIPYKLLISEVPIPNGVSNVKKAISPIAADSRSQASINFENGNNSKNSIINFYVSELKKLGWTECNHGFNTYSFNKWDETSFKRGSDAVHIYLNDGFRLGDTSTEIFILRGETCLDRQQLLVKLCTLGYTGLTRDGNTQIWEMKDNKNNLSFYQLNSEAALYDDLGKAISKDERKDVSSNMERKLAGTCSEILK